MTKQVLGVLKPKYDAQMPLLLAELEPKKDIEALLSRVRALSKVIGNTKVHGLDAAGYETFGADICTEIGRIVDVRLPKKASAYTDLINWIIGTSRENAVEIFTTNYDLLLEETFERGRAPYFDGFKGGREPFFLISIGFSYADAHIAVRIGEGLAANPASSVFAFQYKTLAEEGSACDLAGRQPNFSIYARDQGMMNGVAGKWQIPADLPSKDWGPIRSTYWGKTEEVLTIFFSAQLSRLPDFSRHLVLPRYFAPPPPPMAPAAPSVL